MKKYVVVSLIVMVVLTTRVMILALPQVDGAVNPLRLGIDRQNKVVVNHEEQGAPQIITDDYMYTVWENNKTGNHEVLFRASNDNGATFGDKINLSNSSDSESIDVTMDADGPSVMVSWWERNQTHDEPVMRISTDGGHTFSDIIYLTQNGTLQTSK